MLHLFLRSRRESQSYDNDSIDDFRIQSIKTYQEVADYCRSAMESGSPVRVHRRRYERLPATICCECYIKAVTAEQAGFRMDFEKQRSLSIVNDRRLQRGCYFADASDYESHSDAESEGI